MVRLCPMRRNSQFQLFFIFLGLWLLSMIYIFYHLQDDLTETFLETPKRRKPILNYSLVNVPPDLEILSSFPIIYKNEKMIIDVPVQIGTSFEQFGILLLDDKSGQVVKSIAYHKNNNPPEINREIIRRWLSREGRIPVTWTTLIQVLNDLHLYIADLVKFSCDKAVLNVPFKKPVYDVTYKFAKQLREAYRNDSVIDRGQTLPGRMENVTLPFIATRFSKDAPLEVVLGKLQPGTKLLITGRPGVGKTTSTRFIASKWTRKELLTQFQLVLHVSLDVIAYVDSLEDLLKKTSAPNVLRKQIAEEILNGKGEGVCFILDTYDQYIQAERGDFIEGLIRGKELQLTKSAVIVTSRSSAAEDIKTHFNQRLEMVGFREDDIDEYLRQLELPQSLTTNISSYLERNPNVKQMCYLPLHMMMVVYIATADSDRLSLIDTETKLYHGFMHLTIEQYEKRHKWSASSLDQCFSEKESKQPLCILLRRVCKLAFERIKEQTFDMSALKDLPDEIGSEKLEALSLFKIEKVRVGYQRVEKYYYSHRTFQEFLAALYLSVQPQQEFIITKHSDVLETEELIVKFYFGLIAERMNDSVILSRFVEAFSEDDAMFDTTGLIKIIRETGRGELATKMLISTNEMKENLSLTMSMINPIEQCMYVEYILRWATIRKLIIETHKDHLSKEVCAREIKSALSGDGKSVGVLESIVLSQAPWECTMRFIPCQNVTIV